ncbi:MAG: Substrate-binding region of ABC-type glycine betaine transport system [Pedosphaera sp.]|nr:Substrate-binding region of ABC-type glycine betaine transport system [Pedosphaera sp.]
MRWWAIILGLVMLASPAGGATQRVVVGSKKFTESYVLGEIAKRVLEENGIPAAHRQGMGGTIILWEALTQGAITSYPEYTGTIREEILKTRGPTSLERMRQELATRGIGVTGELGFNNTYALVMRRERARRLGIVTISDLRKHPELVVGVTHEFLERKDGWKPLAERYGLKMRDVRGIDHALGYVALANGTIDLKDAYSTDAKIAENDLVVLEDDLGFFPQYHAVFLYRLDADPRVPAALRRMEGTLSDARMIQLNASAEQTKDYSLAASLYFRERGTQRPASLAANIARWTARHLLLVGVSLLFSIVIGIPLGIWASRPGFISQLILGTTGLVQTIPSLALLALLVSIPALGISPLTAIIALVLYGLLPIVRNTATGIQDIAVPLRESAAALGLEPRAQLFRIFLPMASRSILGGIKTSAVISVGTATLAALIGAGGLGEPIISGLNLNDHATILEGAIPAAVLAFVVQIAFDGLDRLLIPKGLRLRANRG